MGYRDYQNGPRHSGGNRGQNGGRSRREPLRDHYYYEEPPRGWKEGDAFQDISSYSSPEKRRADQKAMEDQRRSAQRASGRNAGKSGKNSQDIYSSSRPVRRKRPAWERRSLRCCLFWSWFWLEASSICSAA